MKDDLNQMKLELGQIVYHEKLYWGKEPMKVVGIREKEVELEGDYSGGTHAVCQKDWLPLDGILLSKSGTKDDKKSEFSDLNEEAKKVWANVDRLRKEGKLPPPPTPEEMADEPTALANSGYRERAEREERKYPPISPETSDSKPMGALGRRKEEESKKALEELKRRALDEMKIQLALDPEIEWIVKTIDGKSYLSVKQN